MEYSPSCTPALSKAMRTLVIFLIMLLVAHPLGAEERKIFIRGDGRAPCSAWLNVRSQSHPDRLLVHQWVLGYITSYNVNNLSTSADVANAIDAGALFESIDTWCREHPTDSVEKALAVLIETWKTKFGTR